MSFGEMSTDGAAAVAAQIPVSRVEVCTAGRLEWKRPRTCTGNERHRNLSVKASRCSAEERILSRKAPALRKANRTVPGTRLVDFSFSC